MSKAQKEDMLTGEQVDALADFLIQGKRLIFAPAGTDQEREAARRLIQATVRIRDVFE